MSAVKGQKFDSGRFSLLDKRSHPGAPGISAMSLSKNEPVQGITNLSLFEKFSELLRDS